MSTLFHRIVGNVFYKFIFRFIHQLLPCSYSLYKKSLKIWFKSSPTVVSNLINFIIFKCCRHLLFICLENYKNVNYLELEIRMKKKKLKRLLIEMWKPFNSFDSSNCSFHQWTRCNWKLGSQQIPWWMSHRYCYQVEVRMQRENLWAT